MPYMMIGNTNPDNTEIEIVTEVKILTINSKTKDVTTVTMATETVSRNISSKI